MFRKEITIELRQLPQDDGLFAWQVWDGRMSYSTVTLPEAIKAVGEYAEAAMLRHIETQLRAAER